MTVAEFYADLAAETKRRGVRWYGSPGCPIRTSIPADDVPLEDVCPITFVAFTKLKQHFGLRNFKEAASAIGLTRWKNIAEAADGCGGSHRTRLLEATGLED